MKKYQLSREFAKKWIEALRSGKYKKAHACYKSGNCFCAIGLGYHVNGYKLKDKSNYMVDNSADFIYHKILELWVAITKMSDNDMPFPEIADWIEKNVEFTDQ